MPAFSNGENFCLNGYTCPPNTPAATSSQCPINSYCVKGETISCPKGTYGSTIGLADVSECVQCQPGYICPNFNINKIQCRAGYYCPGGVSSDTVTLPCPTGETCPMPCPIGFMCPTGSASPTACPPGSYQNFLASSTCSQCPAGFFCQHPGTVTPVACPTDQYCPAGSIIPTLCWIGEYPSSDGTECLSCPAGEYCWPDLIPISSGSAVVLSI
jgi:hypothetical protein